MKRRTAYRRVLGDEVGPVRWLADMEASTDRLAKRLGADRLARVKRLLVSAWRRQCSGGDHGGHRDWIRILLQEYYDPMYDYQLSKKSERVVFRGGFDEVLAYLRARERSGEAAGREPPAGR